MLSSGEDKTQPTSIVQANCNMVLMLAQQLKETGPTACAADLPDAVAAVKELVGFRLAEIQTGEDHLYAGAGKGLRAKRTPGIKLAGPQRRLVGAGFLHYALPQQCFNRASKALTHWLLFLIHPQIIAATTPSNAKEGWRQRRFLTARLSLGNHPSHTLTNT